MLRASALIVYVYPVDCLSPICFPFYRCSKHLDQRRLPPCKFVGFLAPFLGCWFVEAAWSKPGRFLYGLLKESAALQGM